jgi:peroxiredoxin
MSEASERMVIFPKKVKPQSGGRSQRYDKNLKNGMVQKWITQNSRYIIYI